MIYNTGEMRRLYDSIENNLDEETKETLRKMMATFNGIVRAAARQKQYIEDHEKEYADNMNENHKLKQKNKLLEEKIDRLELHKKSMQNEISEYKAILKKHKIKL